MVLFLFFQIFFASVNHVAAVEYQVFQDVYLQAERIFEYDVMPLGFCIQECEKRTRCISVNFDKDTFNCSLYDSSHFQADVHLANSTRFIHALLTKKSLNCIGCTLLESCIQVSSFTSSCIQTECSTARPNVNNSNYDLSFDPYTVSFSCQPGYTGVGKMTISSCFAGEPWSVIDYRCEPPVDGSWSNWGAYGTCSVTCGGGKKSRSRTCTNPAPMYGGAVCTGASTSSAVCNTANCPIDGSWSNWGTYGTCSVTCGGGKKSRSRTCTNPAPMYGGSVCSGASTSSAVCNTDNCPIDGSWSNWGAYGTCSVTCGGGKKSRSRTCTKPAPMYGGAVCTGASTSSVACNTDNCPIHGSWSPWEPYGSCSVTCGGGTKSRSRSCTNPTPKYGGASCHGSSTSSQSCKTALCPDISP